MSNDTNEDVYNKLRIECWNGALHAFGYAYIYSYKATKLRKFLKFNTFLGILIPALIGATVTTYGIQSSYLNLLISILSPLAILQFILSIYIVSYNIEDKYSYYVESTQDNNSISNKFEELAKFPPKSISIFKSDLQKIISKQSHRDSSDKKYPVSDRDKRIGMRYSLRKYKRSCAGCNNVPKDMNSSNCGVCGNF